MEGRDIGTAVFPDADVKVFLDASPEARSQRRYEQNSRRQGADASADPATSKMLAPAASRRPASAADRAAVSQELRERDERDRNRASSPLRPAPDAIIIDSTNLRLEEVLAKIEELVRPLFAEREPARKGG